MISRDENPARHTDDDTRLHTAVMIRRSPRFRGGRLPPPRSPPADHGATGNGAETAGMALPSPERILLDETFTSFQKEGRTGRIRQEVGGGSSPRGSSGGRGFRPLAGFIDRKETQAGRRGATPRSSPGGPNQVELARLGIMGYTMSKDRGSRAGQSTLREDKSAWGME